jgi:tetratricopeptide (TPR) repeat protein
MLKHHAQTHNSALARLAPELLDRLPGLPAVGAAEAETERFLLFEAVAELFAETSRGAPVVLVLDDLQWAGASDLLLLRHIVRLVTPLSLLIVGTFRDSDVGPDHPMTKLLADLRREAVVTRITLDGLDEAAVLHMVEASGAGRDGGSADARTIQRDTAGNPFFIGEVLRDRAESRLSGDVEAVPESVKEVIDQRLGRLEPEAGRVLGLAAVIGQQFELAVLEAVAGETTTGDRLLDILDEATGAGLIAEASNAPDHYHFHHGLVRMALCEGLSGARRRRVHRRVAETLEALGDAASTDRIEQLAYHWLAGADAADLPKAIAFARQAGLNAATGLAYESAAAHFERALEAVTATDSEAERLRCDLLLDLGGVQRSAGQPIFRATTMRAADIARGLGDARRLALAALGSGHLGGVQWENAVDPNLAALYREAIAGLDRRDDPLKITLMGRLAVELRVGPERDARDRLSAEALALARESGDGALLAQALSARIFAIEDPSTLSERLAITAELEALCADLGQLELGCLVASQRFHALLESGDSVAAEAAMMRCEGLAARLRAPFLAMFPRVLRTVWALMRGDADAEARVNETLQAGLAIRMPHATNMYGGQIFGLRTRQGRLGEFLASVRAARDAYPNIVSFRAALIFALCETGALEEAQQEMDLFAADGLILPLDMNFYTGVPFCAESCGALGDARSAALLYPQVEPFATLVACQSGIGCDGSLGHAAGLLAACQGRWTEAEDHFRHALETNDRIGARPAAVSTRRAYATMLCDRGAADDRSLAADLVEAAEAEATVLGLVKESARLSALRARL